MSKYTACFRFDSAFATLDVEADTPAQALSKAQELYANDRSDLWFEPYGGMPVNEIAIKLDTGDEVALWRDEDLRLRFAAQDLLEALNQAVTALNTAPRFNVTGHKDSYQVAAMCERAIAKTKGGAS